MTTAEAYQTEMTGAQQIQNEVEMTGALEGISLQMCDPSGVGGAVRIRMKFLTGVFHERNSY